MRETKTEYVSKYRRDKAYAFIEANGMKIEVIKDNYVAVWKEKEVSYPTLEALLYNVREDFSRYIDMHTLKTYRISLDAKYHISAEVQANSKEEAVEKCKNNWIKDVKIYSEAEYPDDGYGGYSEIIPKLEDYLDEYVIKAKEIPESELKKAEEDDQEDQ